MRADNKNYCYFSRVKINKMVEAEKWFVIVNPNAGKKRGLKDWGKIKSLLEANSLRFYVSFTERQHDAIQYTQDAILQGYRRFIVVGGDGTMNEVVNGVFLQKSVSGIEITLAMIPIGTGNDWVKIFNIPKVYEQSIKLIAEGKTEIQDAGLVHYIDDANSEKKRYFANIAGVGFDAIVTDRTNRLKDKGKSGVLLYFYSLLVSLLHFRSPSVLLEIDGVKVSGEIFSISIGIGRFKGGGMITLPNSVIDDGLFDLTVIKKMRRREVIRNVSKLYNGTILSHPKVEAYQAQTIFLDANPKIKLEADGESLGHSPFKFEILPNAVKVISGN